MRTALITALPGILLAANTVSATVVTDQPAIANGNFFDYVIVGAGLSGLVVANKLSAQNHSTLVIEAGPDGSWNNLVRYADDLTYPPVFCNWNYPRYDDNGHRMSQTISAGRCIGGSTSNGRHIFGPEISLVNIDQIWQTGASSMVAALAEPSSLESRAQALVSSGAAVNIEGAKMILNTTIELILENRLPIAEVVAESYATSLNTPFWPLMPLSRGHIHIASSDPFQTAIITPRFLTDTFDQQVGVATARRLRNLFSNKAFEDIVENAYQYPPLGPNATDAEYLGWLQETVLGASHWIGATAMLPRALGGVVDARLR
ncbi:glucose oxidase [Cordyceps militaris CM01]|uniref:Glucose oxidase n=1 Tax=Cordyceps militaris (strain CM01) TaxID=983644 RepID=G3JB63_CORMM|nr:glucose oxidase [Cordyceps militaris CM01]EGX94423.1 glucose oxidase [Cordyceps militaris CM01]